MKRLIERARTHRHDPNLLTGLVQALRYCGLLDASLAAHHLANKLDPHVKTSVAYTYLQLEQFQEALDHCPAPSDFYVVAPALEALGRVPEAITAAKELEKTLSEPFRWWFSGWLAFFMGNHQKGVEIFDRAAKLTDPEAHFYNGCLMAKAAYHDRAFRLLSLAIENGYACHHGLLHDRWLDSLRSELPFTQLIERAAEQSRKARAVFLELGGDRLLGIEVSPDPAAT